MNTFRKATLFRPPIVKAPAVPPLKVVQSPVEAIQLSVAPTRKTKPSEITFSISVLAFNKLRITQDCLRSVFRNSGPSYELLLWDNNSTDGTREYFDQLAREHKHIRVTHSPTNLGFIEPNREHLKKARGKYLVLLNNDARVPPGWLEALEKPFLEHPRAALSGPSGTCCELGPDFHGRPGHTLEYIEGSCLCAPAALLREHGFFNPSLNFAYGEDCDLSLRMRELGHTIHHTSFHIDHMGSATSRGMPGIRAIQRYNLTVLQKRWGHYIKVRKMEYPILIRRQGSVGDVLLTTPIVRALKAQKPLSRVIVETACPEIYRDNPNVNAIRHAGSVPDDMLVIDLNMAYENRPMVNYLEAYEQVSGIEVQDRRPELFTRPVEKEWASKTLEAGRWCAIHPGISWQCRIWPMDRWTSVACWLNSQGVKVVIIGTGIEPIGFLDLRNRTTIHQLAAIMEHCKLFVGIDSFPFHCAVAAGIPAVGLFGISYSHIVIPKGTSGLGIDADPAHSFSGVRSKAMGTTKIHCPDNPLLTISVEQVIEKLRQILP